MRGCKSHQNSPMVLPREALQKRGSRENKRPPFPEKYRVLSFNDESRKGPGNLPYFTLSLLLLPKVRARFSRPKCRSDAIIPSKALKPRNYHGTIWHTSYYTRMRSQGPVNSLGLDIHLSFTCTGIPPLPVRLNNNFHR